MDPEKLLFVFVVAVIVFGPDKLPQIAKQLAYLVKKWHELRDNTMGELKSGFKEFTGTEMPSYKTASISSFLLGDTKSPRDGGEPGASKDPGGETPGKGALGSDLSEQDGVVVQITGAGVSLSGPVASPDFTSQNPGEGDESGVCGEEGAEEVPTDGFGMGTGFYDPSFN